MTKVWAVALVVAMAMVAHPEAQARRMGGGKSMGQQSSNVTQRQASQPGATPQAPAQGTASQQAASRPAAAPQAAPAAAPRKPWGSMLGGLAAGLGLAWLAHSLGLGEAFANMLMFGLLALAIMVVVGFVLRARSKPRADAMAVPSPFAFQSAGASVDAPVHMPPQYNPEKVGNDASARPWEQAPAAKAAGAAGGSMIGAALGASTPTWSVPEGFDAAGFLDAAKRNFVTLQAAWDRSDVATLRSMMTDEMLGEIRVQLTERETQSGGAPNQTDVVMLDAQLLGIEDLDHAYMASVEFSGMIREDASTGPSPFREVWNMTKPKSGASGWLVAGVQALQ